MVLQDTKSVNDALFILVRHEKETFVSQTHTELNDRAGFFSLLNPLFPPRRMLKCGVT